MLLLKYRAQAILFLVLAGIYIAQITMARPNEIVLKKYGISATEATLLGLAIALPYILIWFIALIGYLRVRCYADTIKANKDGRAMHIIAWGLFLFALWLPFSTIISNTINRLTVDHPQWIEESVIIGNYLNMLLLAPAFILLYFGSKKLLSLTRQINKNPSQRFVIIYLIFATLYTFWVLHDPVRSVPSEQVLKATYYLPDFLIILTIVIPRLILWYLGFCAIHNILQYKERVKGSLYKIALYRFAIGLCGVVVATIALRCFQSFSAYLATFSLGMVLITIYLLLTVMCASYILLYKGSGKLLFIEKL